MAEELQLILTAVDKMSGSIESVSKQLKGLDVTAGKVQGGINDMQGSFLSASRALVGFAAGFVSLQAGISFLKSSVAAARESQEEQLQLKRQVEATGISWDKYSQRIQQTIKSVSDYAIVQDQVASGALRRMILISGDAEASMSNLKLAFDLAAAKGIDLQLAADLVARASAGNVEMLGRFLPELRNLDERLGKSATAADKAAFALKVVSEKTAGAAGTMPEFTKQVKLFEKAWAELSETLGMKVLPVLTSVFSVFNKMLEGPSAKQLQNHLERLNEDFNFGRISAFHYRRSVKETIDELAKLGRTMASVSDQSKGPMIAPGLGGLSSEEQGKKQEELGKAIQSMAQSVWNAKQSILKEEGKAQESLGTAIRDSAKMTFDYQAKLDVDLGKIQEQRGLDIQQQAKANFEAQQQWLDQFHALSTQTWQVFSIQSSQAIANAIVFGENFGEAFKNIMKNVAASFIAGLIQMGIQRILTAIIFNTTNLTESTTRMAVLSAETFAGAFAATVAIPVIGPALAPAVATASLATMLAGAGAAGAVGAGIGAGVAAFAEGGIVTRPTMALIGESGPEAVVPLRERSSAGFGSNQITINFNGPILGDRQQARTFALEIDKQLYELKRRNLSVAFA